MVPLALAVLLAATSPFPAGAVTERVACQADPSVHYDLYLPSTFTPQRTWPILYLYDPRGRARLALDLFREAAEERGVIVASSHDTRSDTNDSGMNVRAIEAMWRDTAARLPLAPRRSYAGGFSGGARLASAVAAGSQGEVAGVFLAGAGFWEPERLPEEIDFAVFGAVGNTDFNHLEMRRLDEQLDRGDAPHRIEVFEGRHGWPPPALAREGLLWLELQAARAGRAPSDPAVAQALLEIGTGRARQREAEADLLGALETWEALARDLDGLADVSAAQAAVKRLRALPEIEAERRRRKQADEQEADFIARLGRVFGRLADAAAPRPRPADLARELEIERWQDRARNAGTAYERLAADRRLENAHVQAAFYVPRILVARGEPLRAAVAYQLALQIAPEVPGTHYNLACAWALGGRKKDALAALARAIDLGYSDAEHIAADPDLVSLRGEREFQALVGRARR